MKKLLLLFASVFLYIGSFAVTGNPLPIAPGDTGYTNVTASVNVLSISFSGIYQKYIIVQQIGDSVWLNGYATPDSGIGIKTNSITGLYRATNYRWAVVFRKNNVFDTMFGGTFRTLNVPSFPTFSIQKIQKIGTSMLVIKVVGDIHLRSSIFGLYYNPSYQMTNIIQGTGTWTDTIRLITPTASTTYGYCLQFLPDTITGLKDSLMCYGESITTPAITDGSIFNQSATNVTEDSATINAMVQLGTYTGTIQFHIKDPASTSYLQSSPVIPVNTNGNYSYTFSGLSDGKDYSYVVIFRDTLDSDTLPGHFTTLSIPRISAPTPIFYGGAWSDCGLGFASIRVTPATGDTFRFVIVRRTDATIYFPDTIFRLNLQTRTVDNVDIPLSAPLGDTRFYYKIIAYSKDNAMSESNIINILTPAGNIPAIGVQVEGMTNSPTPYITFTSDGMCDFSTTTVEIKKSPSSVPVFTDSIEVGVGQYQGLIDLPNFINGDYHVEVCIYNRYGSPTCYEKDFRRALVTGIIEHKPEEFDPTTEVDVTPIGGQLLGKIPYDQLDYSGISKGAVILHYVKKPGEEYSWKYLIK